MNELLHKTKHESDGSTDRASGAPDLGGSRSMRHSLRGMDYSSAVEALSPASSPPVQMESAGQSMQRSPSVSRSQSPSTTPQRSSAGSEGESTAMTGSGASSGAVVQMERDEESVAAAASGDEVDLAPKAPSKVPGKRMRGTGGKYHTKHTKAGISAGSLAMGAGRGFLEILLVLPALKSGIDTLLDLRKKGETHDDKRILFDELGQGWRYFEMAKELFQTVTNVATGVSVVAGIVSIFVPGAIAVAGTAGIVATIGHTVVACMRLLSLGRVQQVINKLPHGFAGPRANILKAQRSRDIGGLVANLIGVLAGGLTGGYPGGPSPIGTAIEGAVSAPAEGAAAGTANAQAGIGTSVGQAFNTTQDVVGTAAEGHAKSLEKSNNRMARADAVSMTPEEAERVSGELQETISALQEIAAAEEAEAASTVSTSSAPPPELEEMEATLNDMTGQTEGLEQAAATVDAAEGEQTVDRDPTEAEIAALQNAEAQMGGLESDEETTGETGDEATGQTQASQAPVQQSKAKGSVQFAKKGGRVGKWAKRKWDQTRAKFKRWIFKCLGVKEPARQARQDIKRIKDLYAQAPAAAAERVASANALKSQADQLKDLAGKY